MSDWRVAEPVNVVRWRRGKTALNNHPVPLASAPVAHLAVNFKALAATLEHFLRHRHGKVCHQVGSDHPGVKRLIFVQMPARDSMRRNGPGSSFVGKKIAFLEGIGLGLIKHVPAAGASKE